MRDRIEKGEIIGRVTDVMLAGNTYEALNNIVAIGEKAEWVGGISFYAAYADCLVQCSGKVSRDFFKNILKKISIYFIDSHLMA